MTRAELAGNSHPATEVELPARKAAVHREAAAIARRCVGVDQAITAGQVELRRRDSVRGRTPSVVRSLQRLPTA